MHSLILACSAALVFLLATLSVNVSRLRRKVRAKPALGDGELVKAIRAQGNAAEYIPLFVALVLYMDYARLGAGAILVGVALIATISRFAHAIGMLTAKTATSTNPLKMVGAVGTYIALLLLAGSLAFAAIA